ncbi:MAG: hypothetical protein RLZZ342_645 [Candidatus Parcubacteria bacterium]|jgi:hypothetical protein
MSERIHGVAFSPMNVIAGASFVVLCGALAWTALNREPETAPIFARALESAPTDTDFLDIGATSSATSSTPLGDAILAQFISNYTNLSAQGALPDQVAETAADIVPHIETRTFSESAILTRTDTSLAGILQYRAELREALTPLLNNTTPELDMYAQWIDTGDTTYLDKLSAIARDYDAAILRVEKVRAPADAVQVHAGILNAMSSFATALRALAHNAQDPVASLTLLRTYNMAEQQMFTAFNTLGLYAAAKTQ